MIKHFRTFEDDPYLPYLIEPRAGLETLVIRFDPDRLTIGLVSDHYTYKSTAPIQPLQNVLNKVLSQGWTVAEYFDIGIVFERPLQPHADQFVIGKALATTGT